VELREIHPLRKSPVITEGDRVIAESGAIIDYIVRRHHDGPRNLVCVNRRSKLTLYWCGPLEPDMNIDPAC
jgi:glutathione S-transferase